MMLPISFSGDAWHSMRKPLESLFDHESVTRCLEDTKRYKLLFYSFVTWTFLLHIYSIFKEFFSNFTIK